MSSTETIIKQYPEDGICYPQITINIRNKPCATTGVVLDQYYKGESVIYDHVYITNKYVWISWISGGGRRVYMAVKDQVSGERYGNCEDIPGGTGGTGNVQFLNLHPHMQSWAVYNQNGPYTVANAIGKLAPAQFGGLSYPIVGEKGNDIYLIDTVSFGRCAIWAPRDNDSSITLSPDYSNGGSSGGIGTPSGNETIVSQYPESGICYPQMTINIRSKPCSTTGEVLDQYYLGESVIYDYVVITNKYVWISWIGGSGRRVYMTVRDQLTGERWGNCTDVPSGGAGSTGGSGVNGIKKIFIDPGHGGSEAGAVGNGLIEKNIALSIALKLGAKLQAKGFEIKYSRTSDVYVDFRYERAKMANDWGADLFISIHSNALDGTGNAYGTECYTHPNDVYSTRLLSAEICNSICNKLGTYNRGHKNADYAVLRGTVMPAILIETAFIDNTSDASLLRNRQDDFATAICDVLDRTGSSSGGGNSTPEPDDTIQMMKDITNIARDYYSSINSSANNTMINTMSNRFIMDYFRSIVYIYTPNQDATIIDNIKDMIIPHWNSILGEPHAFSRYIKEKQPKLHEKFYPYIKKGSDPFIYRGHKIDLKHLAATTLGYFLVNIITPDYFTGWGGDLATGVQDILKYKDDNKNNLPLPSDNYIASKLVAVDGYSCSPIDIHADVDAIDFANKLGSKALNILFDDYYTGGFKNRKSLIINDIKNYNVVGGVNTLTDEVYGAYTTGLPGLMSLSKYTKYKDKEKTIVDYEVKPSKSEKQAACKIFAEYVESKL